MGPSVLRGTWVSVVAMLRTSHITRIGTVAALALTASSASAVTLTRVGTFDQPVYVTAPPGDTERVFIVERTGRIRVIVKGTPIRRPFLHIARKVSQPTSIADERGLMSMAFAPDYATSGRFYVYHTVRKPGKPKASDVVLDEYRAVPPSANRVDPNTRRRILRLNGNVKHFGGQVAFGPDGMLWLGPGDARGPGDPSRNGQNTKRLHGKILRIDPRPGRRLAVADNPFVRGGGGKLVWAYGLRNPYRFSFDRVTGDLAIGDVGQNVVEEIDFVSREGGLGRAANFGWSRLEGRYRFRRNPPFTLRSARRRDLPRRYVAPAIEHLHSRGWCAIIGGYVVRDRALPELYGKYVYGDFCRGRINTTVLRAGRRATPRPLGVTVPLLSSFGEDGCGRVYATSLNGPVYRLSTSGACAGPASTPFPVPAPAPPVAAATAARPSAGWLAHVRDAFVALRPVRPTTGEPTRTIASLP